jgi:hypothetical protein
LLRAAKKERKKTRNPREGWEDGTPPPHRDFKERCVMRYSGLRALRKRTIKKPYQAISAKI